MRDRNLLAQLSRLGQPDDEPESPRFLRRLLLGSRQSLNRERRCRHQRRHGLDSPRHRPTASDTVLVTQYGYNSAGWVNSHTDLRGIVEQESYDNLGEL